MAAATREQVLRSLVTFINGLTASAVANPGDWPAAKQIAQLRLQLQLLHAWAMRTAARGRRAAGGARLSAPRRLRCQFRTTWCTAASP